jgi:ComF family protein
MRVLADTICLNAPPAPRQPKRWRLPSPCGVCGIWSSPAGLCRDCLSRFASVNARCQRCALRVPEGQPLCGRCMHQPLRFERALAAFDYAFPWDRVIAEFKFREGLGWAAPLARCLADRVQGDTALPIADLITAVPLSPQRLQRRGYNQSWEIARRTAALLRRPCEQGLLLRLRDTPQQAQLDHSQRNANLRGAFMPGGASAREAVKGRCVALVDDVLTTGATADEAAGALLEAGARAVHVWVLARTERDGA